MVPTPLLTAEQHGKNHVAVRRFLTMLRTDPPIDESEMAIFVAAVRAVILETPAEVIAQITSSDPRAVADQRLADSVTPTVDMEGNPLDPAAPPPGLLDGLKPAEGAAPLGDQPAAEVKT